MTKKIAGYIKTEWHNGGRKWLINWGALLALAGIVVTGLIGAASLVEGRLIKIEKRIDQKIEKNREPLFEALKNIQTAICDLKKDNKDSDNILRGRIERVENYLFAPPPPPKKGRVTEHNHGG